MSSHPFDTFILKSPHLCRQFELRDGRLTTVAYHAAGSDEPLVELPVNEGRVVFNGRTQGLADGDVDGWGCVGSSSRSLPDGGQELAFHFRGAKRLPQELEVSVVYQAPGAVPVLLKRVRVENRSGRAIRLDGIELERFIPQVHGAHTLLLENDYVRDGMLVEGQRAYSPWIENHHEYIDAFLNPRQADTRFAYPVHLDRWLVPGQSFQSFCVFEFVVPNGSEQERGLAFRSATRTLFPWTCARWLSCKLAPAVEIQDYYLGIDSAAEAGFEAVSLHHGWVNGDLTSPIFTNYNDYQLRPELFPGGWEDVRKLTDYAHQKGLKIAYYTIYVNTWRAEAEGPKILQSNDWELRWAEEDTSSRWGVTLDPATGWGPFVNRKIEESIVQGGFDAWHLDGPYYGDICVAEDREYLPGGPNQAKAWERQVEFYQRMRALNIHGEAAQGFQAMAHGMSRITTTGYNEGDFGSLPIWDQISSNRKAAYGFTRLYRPEAAANWIPVMPWSPDPDAPSLMPLEEHAAEYDAYLANVFGYGFEGAPFMRVAFDGPKSRAAAERWLGFRKLYAEFFEKGFLIHVREPDGGQIDAVLHVITGERPRALLVAYNPAGQEQTGRVDLSALSLAGLDLEGWRRRDGGGAVNTADLCQFEVRVPARNASWLELFREVSPDSV